MVLTLLPHCRIKCSSNGKVLPRCGRKKAQSDLVSLSLSLSLSVYMLLLCFAFMFLSQSSFMLYFF